MGNSGEMPSKEIKLNLAPVKREGINTLKASCYSTICLQGKLANISAVGHLSLFLNTEINKLHPKI